MTRVIIGVHGLGNKPDKDTLHEWWKRSIHEGLEKNGFKNPLPEIEMVYWADIMHEKPLDKTIGDPESPLYIDEAYTPQPPNYVPGNNKILQRVLVFLGKQINKIFLNDDFTLNYSFIADFIVRKYFRDMDIYYREDCRMENYELCKVKELIKKRLSYTLEKHKDNEIMLVSHSMGSIVAFDVMSFISPEIKVHTFVTLGSPLGLPLIVSKIATQYKNSPKGKKEMITPPGVYKRWYNFYDVLDKITLNQNLGLRYEPNHHMVKPKDIKVVNDYHSQEGIHNPHKSFGYLRNKEFAAILNGFLTG